MFDIRKPVLGILLYAFIFHGALYYLFPESHYRASGGSGTRLAYLKYIIIFTALPFLVHTNSTKNSVHWATFGFLILTSTLVSSLYWANTSNQLLIQFQIPILAYFFAPFAINLSKDEHRLRRLLNTLLISTFLLILFEVLYGTTFGDYSRSGLRAAGPFINPNNTGIVVGLTATTLHFLTTKTKHNILIFLIAAISIVITGSKTASALYIVGILCTFKYSTITTGLAGIALLVTLNYQSILLALSNAGLRELTLESSFIRGKTYTNLMQDISDRSIWDAAFGSYNQSFVDNTYIDIYSFGGMYLLFIFTFLQLLSIYFCVKNKLRFLLIIHLLFFLAMLTTNIARLWPTGYVFWLVIGISSLYMTKSAHRSELKQNGITEK